MGGPPPLDPKYNRVAPPSSLRDLPRFLREVICGFFKRLLYIFSLVWKTSRWIPIVLMIVAVLEGILPIISSIITRNIMNELQNIISLRVAAEHTGTAFTAVFWGSMLMFLLVFFFVFRILSQLVTRLNSAITRIAGEQVVRYVKVQIIKKAKEIDIASFDMPEFYEKLENANREAGIRPIQVLSSTFDTISKVISLVSYIVILATAPGMWWTAIVMLLVSAPTAAINFSYRKKNFMYMRRRSRDRRQMNYYSELMVNKDMVKEIRMFDLSDEFIGRYEGIFTKYYSGIKRLIIKENIWHIVTTLVSSVVNCAFFAIIAYMVFQGKIQIGDYSLYTNALTSISTTVASLIAMSATVYEGTLFIDNLISFMEERPTVVPTAKEPRKIDHGKPHKIEFVNVSFSYPGNDRRVLSNVSFVIEPGETLVLVGLNGAGKTTLLKLLTRLYDTTEGEILFDGYNIKEYDVKDLYRTFGIIFQDFGKYAFTVAENIKFGSISREFDRDEIADAARAANVHDYIQTLPQGYDTPLMKYFDPGATELSIGQWQKLSVARAFYSDADVLILDEPTASLDPIAEQEIFKQFDTLREDKTTIFVSHRLSSATIASKIVVLENGRLIEMGTHRALMEKGGKYYHLFSTQAKRYIEQEKEQR